MTVKDQTDPSGGSTAPEVAQIQADIERTRRDLGETVDALSAKLDVSSRAKAGLADTRDRAAGVLRDTRTRAAHLAATAQDRATDDAGRPRTPLLAVAGGVLALTVAGVLLGRRRR